MIKVLVCGSRIFNDWEYLSQKLDEILDSRFPHDEIIIISGSAKGADTLALYYANQNGDGIEAYPADWETYGNKAGILRNVQMLEQGNPDLVVAFPRGKAKGTRHMIKIAKEAGVEVIEV